MLVQHIEAYISSQNGKLSTHSLAVLVTKPTSSNQSKYPDNKEATNRVNKNDMTNPIGYNNYVERYNDPVKPNMPIHAMQLTRLLCL